MKRLLILGATPFQVPLIEMAKKMGNYVITADYDLNNPGHKYSNESIKISTVNKDSILEYSRSKKIDGILTGASDVAVSTVGFICDELSLPGISLKQGNILTKKHLFRKFQEDNAFNHPEYFEFDDFSEFMATLIKIKGKYILKPVDRSGSIGVKIISLPLKKEYMGFIEDHFIEAKNSSIIKKVILEEFIEGIEYGGDIFLNDQEIKSFNITNKELLGEKYVIPIGHTIPVRLSQEVQNSIKFSIKTILDKLEINNGPINFDVMVTKDNEVVILEMSPRFGGNGIPQIIKTGTGFDTLKESINTALDLPSEFFKKETSNPAGSRILKSLKTGRLKYITPVKDILLKFPENIKELVYDYKPGDQIYKFDQGNKRIGHFIVVSNELEQLEHIIREIESKIIIIVD